MEKFVVRGDALKALNLPAASNTSQKKRLRQTAIVDGSKVVVEEFIQHLKEELDDAKTSSDIIMILNTLEQHFISLEMMEKTLIGRTLTRIERQATCPKVKAVANRLLKEWKKRAKIAIRRRNARIQTFGKNFAD